MKKKHSNIMPRHNPFFAEDLNAIHAALAEYWDLLRDGRLLVTGGTGIIGKWLLQALLDADLRRGLNLRVDVLSRSPAAFAASMPALAGDARIRWLHGDVRSFKVDTDARYDYVVHAATDVVNPLNQADVLDSCVIGTKNVLFQAARSGVKRLLLLSSGAVYGKAPKELGAIGEDFCGSLNCLDPASAYAEGKRCSELLCSLEAARSGMQIPVARCFALVGPYLPLGKHFAIGNFIEAALARKPIIIHGDGTPVRSYLYMADVTIWLLTLLFAGRSCVAYNVGSEDAVSIRDLAALVNEELGGGLPINIENQSYHGAHADIYYPSTARIRGEFSLPKPLPLRTAIARTAAWYSTQVRLE